MIRIQTRYAQEKPGQKLHIVPIVGGDENVSTVALCGRHVDHWRMTINVPLGHACGNCVRIDRQRGYYRALEIIQAIFNVCR